LEAGVDFRILGPLEVHDGDRVLSLGGTRQRAVLAVLLLHANEVVSSERIVDELWGEEPPKAAAATIRVFVSELRKLLEPRRTTSSGEVIVTRPPGYLLRVQPGQLDLHRFERLLEQGRQALRAGTPETAATSLREALALWRGPALANFTYEPFAQTAIARLEELRLAGLELRIEADLALGRHTELVGELEALVAEHPLHEAPRRQLMLALYRSGRQSEALDAYRRVRRSLVEELGIEPSLALQELERAILRQDPALELAREAPGPSARARARSIVLVPGDEGNVDALLAIGVPLTRRPPRELIVVQLAASDSELGPAASRVRARRAALVADGVAVRAAAFTSASPADDIVRLASEQDADLLLLDVAVSSLESAALPPELARVLAGTTCDVALLVTREGETPVLDLAQPLLVPFVGVEHDWAAIELAAWLAGSLGVELRILGSAAVPEAGRRDASRLLARASLIVQHVAGVAAEPLLVAPGHEGIVEAAKGGGLVVLGLPSTWRREGIGRTRLAVARNARPPTLLVRKGLRPGGLAPAETHTRFTWTLAGAGG
jgi:DNA-binding SARP family transcriptional activator